MDVLSGGNRNRVRLRLRTTVMTREGTRTCCTSRGTSILRTFEDISVRRVCLTMVDLNCWLSSTMIPWLINDCRAFSLEKESQRDRSVTGVRRDSRRQKGVGVDCRKTRVLSTGKPCIYCIYSSRFARMIEVAAYSKLSGQTADCKRESADGTHNFLRKHSQKQG